MKLEVSVHKTLIISVIHYFFYLKPKQKKGFTVKMTVRQWELKTPMTERMQKIILNYVYGQLSLGSVCQTVHRDLPTNVFC